MQTPRRLMAIVGLSFLLGVLPFLLSRLSVYYGWAGDIVPSIWNLIGLVLVPTGIILIVWAARVFHASNVGSMDRVPARLLTLGPYFHSRNPIYLGYLMIWLAWSIFYGSIVVLAAFLILILIFQFVVIPHEERALSDKFGSEYLDYKKRVPRWFRL